jgi:hypothetical protein
MAETSARASTSTTGGEGIEVTLVAADRETIDVLQAYLSRAGIASHGTPDLRGGSSTTDLRSALVVFPDEFPAQEVALAVRQARHERPTLPIVLVTQSPQEVRALLNDDRHPLPPIVIRKPAAGGMILDAIHVASRPYKPEPSKRQKLPAPASLVAALRSKRRLPDENFDCFLPDDLRAASDQFWTPLDVVVRAAGWLDQLRIESVVDIGSGAGKFCIAGALATGCSFVGIEQRSRLVCEARSLARFFGVAERVSFIEGRFGDVTMPAADCYYLFNPFWENLFEREAWLDEDIELSHQRFRRDVRAAKALLRSLPLGTYVLTYNGMGAPMPDGFDEVLVDRERPGALRLTRKVSIRS